MNSRNGHKLIFEVSCVSEKSGGCSAGQNCLAARGNGRGDDIKFNSKRFNTWSYASDVFVGVYTLFLELIYSNFLSGLPARALGQFTRRSFALLVSVLPPLTISAYVCVNGNSTHFQGPYDSPSIAYALSANTGSLNLGSYSFLASEQVLD
jgi:hypothetical protein